MWIITHCPGATASARTEPHATRTPTPSASGLTETWIARIPAHARPRQRGQTRVSPIAAKARLPAFGVGENRDRQRRSVSKNARVGSSLIDA
eukprot:839930-Rhodomonas_salina.1